MQQIISHETGISNQYCDFMFDYQDKWKTAYLTFLLLLGSAVSGETGDGVFLAPKSLSGLVAHLAGAHFCFCPWHEE